jgi:hypothetical protein
MERKPQLTSLNIRTTARLDILVAKINEKHRAGRLHMFRFKGNWDLENSEEK